MKYSEKRKPAADCATPSCPFQGTILRVIRGRPDWFCTQHANALPRRADPQGPQ